MPYTHKLHLADGRVVPSSQSQDYTPVICGKAASLPQHDQGSPQTDLQKLHKEDLGSHTPLRREGQALWPMTTKNA